MRISDWSSDVCSSDLRAAALRGSDVAGRPRLRHEPARPGGRGSCPLGTVSGRLWRVGMEGRTGTAEGGRSGPSDALEAGYTDAEVTSWGYTDEIGRAHV